jgi:hypothetical protein
METYLSILLTLSNMDEKMEVEQLPSEIDATRCGFGKDIE